MISEFLPNAGNVGINETMIARSGQAGIKMSIEYVQIFHLE